MNWNTLSPLPAFRKEIYACPGSAKDALFDVCDALLTGTQAQSFVALSLSPTFASPRFKAARQVMVSAIRAKVGLSGRDRSSRRCARLLCCTLAGTVRNTATGFSV